MGWHPNVSSVIKAANQSLGLKLHNLSALNSCSVVWVQVSTSNWQV
ncbi:MAG: hypothetical protein ACI845_002690 [Gammaproteobacteria bacterium]|jgi:hypothetical protein